MYWYFSQGACLTHPDRASLEGETSQDLTWRPPAKNFETWRPPLRRTLPRYSLAPYAPGGPVVAAPAGQTAAYRDGATGQVFVRQPVNIIAIDIILDILISSVSLYCMVWRAKFGWYDPRQQLAWFWTYVHADSKLSSSCLVLWSLVWQFWHSLFSVDFFLQHCRVIFMTHWQKLKLFLEILNFSEIFDEYFTKFQLKNR